MKYEVIFRTESKIKEGRRTIVKNCLVKEIHKTLENAKLRATALNWQIDTVKEIKEEDDV